MKEPKVTLKKINYFRGMEGYGVNADLYINGIKCLFIIDSGDGGEMEHEIAYDPINDKVARQYTQDLFDYISQLPEEEIKLESGNVLKLKPDLNLYVNNILEKIEKEKQLKKRNKLFETAIVFGIPNANEYRYFKFKNPLKLYNKVQLQLKFNEIVQKYCTNGVQILNTNLKELGITI